MIKLLYLSSVNTQKFQITKFYIFLKIDQNVFAQFLLKSKEKNEIFQFKCMDAYKQKL